MNKILATIAAALLLVGCQSTQTGGIGNIRPESSYADSPAMANVQLAIAYLRKGDLERALTKLQRALAMDSSLPAAHNAAGLLYERLGDPAKAREHYRRAIELNPSDASAHNNYGQFLCKSGEAEEGEQHFLKAVANPLYGTPFVAYTNAGLCLRDVAAGRAEGYLRQALAQRPDYAPALLEMVRLSVANGEHLQGRAFLGRYLTVAGHTPETLLLGIRIERTLGDRNALASYRLLLNNHYPESEEARLLRRMENDER